MLGDFWKAQVEFKFKCNVFTTTIQGALLSSSCAVACQKGSLSETELSSLDACQNRLARRLLCNDEEELGQRALRERVGGSEQDGTSWGTKTQVSAVPLLRYGPDSPVQDLGEEVHRLSFLEAHSTSSTESARSSSTTINFSFPTTFFVISSAKLEFFPPSRDIRIALRGTLSQILCGHQVWRAARIHISL